MPLILGTIIIYLVKPAHITNNTYKYDIRKTMQTKDHAHAQHNRFSGIQS